MKNKLSLIVLSLIFTIFTGCTDKTEADRNGNSQDTSNGTSIDSGRNDNTNNMKGTARP